MNEFHEISCPRALVLADHVTEFHLMKNSVQCQKGSELLSPTLSTKTMQRSFWSPDCYDLYINPVNQLHFHVIPLISYHLLTLYVQ
jgi:hypothetical protein